MQLEEPVEAQAIFKIRNCKMDEPTDFEVLEAKKELYRLLLNKKNPADSEIRIMFELCNDGQIREFLKENFDK